MHLESDATLLFLWVKNIRIIQKLPSKRMIFNANNLWKIILKTKFKYLLLVRFWLDGISMILFSISNLHKMFQLFIKLAIEGT